MQAEEAGLPSTDRKNPATEGAVGLSCNLAPAQAEVRRKACSFTLEKVTPGANKQMSAFPDPHFHNCYGEVRWLRAATLVNLRIWPHVGSASDAALFRQGCLPAGRPIHVRQWPQTLSTASTHRSGEGIWRRR